MEKNDKAQGFRAFVVDKDDALLEHESQIPDYAQYLAKNILRKTRVEF